MARARAWVWLQLLIGWLPVWALYSMLLASAHPEAGLYRAVWLGFHAILMAALLGLLVHRLTVRLPWPHPLRAGFIAIHVIAAVLYALGWILLTSLLNGVMMHRDAIQMLSYLPAGYVALGVWLYAMVAGVSYAAEAAERAARAEAAAARAQLAALRAQLNPHFLFNALHTVVQLIPREPARAAEAAEQVAGLLRTTVEEDRDLVSLAEEWAFVERYLEIERIRFGDRLQVHSDLSEPARSAWIPSFALQTLVENAVRHGAAPRVEPTEVRVAAELSGTALRLTVSDTGGGATQEQLGAGSEGTGLVRLRERLRVLYGDAATLELTTAPGRGFTATLSVPQDGVRKAG